MFHVIVLKELVIRFETQVTNMALKRRRIKLLLVPFFVLPEFRRAVLAAMLTISFPLSHGKEERRRKKKEERRKKKEERRKKKEERRKKKEEERRKKKVERKVESRK